MTHENAGTGRARFSVCFTNEPTRQPSLAVGHCFRERRQSRNVAAAFRRQDLDVPLNPQLDTLSDYPFEALRTLLNPVTPRVNDPPIVMSVGEPQHQPPALLTETL